MSKFIQSETSAHVDYMLIVDYHMILNQYTLIKLYTFRETCKYRNIITIMLFISWTNFIYIRIFHTFYQNISVFTVCSGSLSMQPKIKIQPISAARSAYRPD